LAHQLQKGILIAVLALGATAASARQKRPFSHKYHLTQVSGCEGCHKNVSTSTQASDNLLPDREACVNCHEEVTIKEPRPMQVQKFNHALHVKMGNPAHHMAMAIEQGKYLAPPGDRKAQLDAAKSACAACHIGIEQSEVIVWKPEGKANFPHMADCLICHTKIDPPESCKKCHSPEFHIKPANHTTEWVNAHSDGKAKLDKSGCAVCHGRTFKCQGCH
jgi:hypothetical protein